MKKTFGARAGLGGVAGCSALLAAPCSYTTKKRKLVVFIKELV